MRIRLKNRDLGENFTGRAIRQRIALFEIRLFSKVAIPTQGDYRHAR
jgi:hypothetical protein